MLGGLEVDYGVAQVGVEAGLQRIVLKWCGLIDLFGEYFTFYIDESEVSHVLHRPTKCSNRDITDGSILMACFVLSETKACVMDPFRIC